MPKESDVQLLPQSVKRIDVQGKGMGKFMITAIVIAALVILAWLGAIAYGKNVEDNIGEIDAQIKSKLDSVNTQDRDVVLRVSRQLSTVQSLISQHVALSNALLELESKTLARARFQTLSIDKNKHTVEAQVIVPTFTDASRQLAAYSSASFVKDLSVSTVERSPEGDIQFGVVLELEPAIFNFNAVQGR